MRLRQKVLDVKHGFLLNNNNNSLDPQPQRLGANTRLLPLLYILVNLLLVVLYGIQQSYSLQYDGYHATYSLLIGFFKNGGKHNAETNETKISPYGGMDVRYGIG